MWFNFEVLYLHQQGKGKMPHTQLDMLDTVLYITIPYRLFLLWRFSIYEWSLCKRIIELTQSSLFISLSLWFMYLCPASLSISNFLHSFSGQFTSKMKIQLINIRQEWILKTKFWDQKSDI